MTTALIQCIFLAGAGALLWKLWKVSAIRGPGFAWIVGLGFILRAGGGLILWTISYYELPLFESLYIGNGLWFFGRDGTIYFGEAAAAAASGPLAIVTLSPYLPSVGFITIFSTFLLLFGRVTSVAILLNLFAYLGMSALISRWAMERDEARRGSLVTLAALAFAPTWILWCSQPLKDAVFMFLVVLLLWCLSIWQRWSGAERPFDRIRMDLAVAFLWVAIGMVAAIRWYFGVFLFGSAGLLMLLVALRRGWRDWRLSLTPIPILWIASWLVVLGAGAYMAPQVRSAMTLGLIGDVEIEVVSQLDARRRGFDSTVGKTAIRPTMLADEIGTTSLGLASERKEQLATEYRKALREARENPGGPVPRKSRELREALDHFHQQADRYAREAVVRSHRERWITTITHAVILVLPRAVVTGIGLAEIGGGRGLWLFAELDTLYFDAFLLIVLIMSYQAGRGVLRDPMWITLMVTTMMVWIPLAYVVTNYGTLFRLRELVFVLIALIPLAADRVRETADQDQRGEL